MSVTYVGWGIMRKMEKLIIVNLKSCSLVYAFWSDGIIEKALLKKNNFMTYSRINDKEHQNGS